MSDQHFTTSFTVDRSPQEVFEAINDVRGWWSEATQGDTDRPGAVFYYHFQDIHRCTIQVTELVPGKRVAWHVLHNAFSFIQDQAEWNGTDVVFDIARKGSQTEVRFTHVGLSPSHECYEICSNAWGQFIGRSLRDLITTDKGQPNPPEQHASHQDELVTKARELSRKLQSA
ncbi:MAG TPA: SRPBCC domain-containing protein [Gammaproteobacteria bacterium]|nr:SRPBCC domain-containing protein [Gammaproteobacteria bacterium]